eukprot:356247-Chlamydomonas_euryale.AAC.3
MAVQDRMSSVKVRIIKHYNRVLSGVSRRAVLAERINFGSDWGYDTAVPHSVDVPYSVRG